MFDFLRFLTLLAGTKGLLTGPGAVEVRRVLSAIGSRYSSRACELLSSHSENRGALIVACGHFDSAAIFLAESLDHEYSWKGACERAIRFWKPDNRPLLESACSALQISKASLHKRLDPTGSSSSELELRREAIESACVHFSRWRLLKLDQNERDCWVRGNRTMPGYINYGRLRMLNADVAQAEADLRRVVSEILRESSTSEMIVETCR